MRLDRDGAPSRERGMERRLKFYGWGYENTGLSENEQEQVFRFLAEKLGVEPRLHNPPAASEIALKAPRVAAPAALRGVLTDDPYERLLHAYGKSYPETVRAFARDFSNARSEEHTSELQSPL